MSGTRDEARIAAIEDELARSLVDGVDGLARDLIVGPRDLYNFDLLPSSGVDLGALRRAMDALHRLPPPTLAYRCAPATLLRLRLHLRCRTSVADWLMGWDPPVYGDARVAAGVVESTTSRMIAARWQRDEWGRAVARALGRALAARRAREG